MAKKQIYQIVLLQINNFLPQRTFTVQAEPGTVEIYTTYKNFKLQINLYNENGIPISIQNSICFGNIIIGFRLEIVNIPDLTLELQFGQKDSKFAKRIKNLGSPTLIKHGKPMQKGDWIIANMRVFPISALYDTANKLFQQKKFYESIISNLNKQIELLYKKHNDFIQAATEPLVKQIEFLLKKNQELQDKLIRTQIFSPDIEAENLIRILDGNEKDFEKIINLNNGNNNSKNKLLIKDIKSK
ncbi:MAG: hypothetical protein ACP6IY_20615 [Promethearchaeia archaeon]